MAFLGRLNVLIHLIRLTHLSTTRVTRAKPATPPCWPPLSDESRQLANSSSSLPGASYMQRDVCRRRRRLLFVHMLFPLDQFFLTWSHLLICSLHSLVAAPPNLNLNPEEKRVYGQLFRQADTESVGVVTGEVAVKFFEKTRLDPRVLGEVGFSFPSTHVRPRCPDDAIRRYGKSQITRTVGSLHQLASASSCA